MKKSAKAFKVTTPKKEVVTKAGVAYKAPKGGVKVMKAMMKKKMK